MAALDKCTGNTGLTRRPLPPVDRSRASGRFVERGSRRTRTRPGPTSPAGRAVSLLCPARHGSGTSTRPGAGTACAGSAPARATPAATGGRSTTPATCRDAAGWPTSRRRPSPVPERLISGAPRAFMEQILVGLINEAQVFDPRALDCYLAASTTPAPVTAMCECFRAGITSDMGHDTADRDAGRKSAQLSLCGVRTASWVTTSTSKKSGAGG